MASKTPAASKTVNKATNKVATAVAEVAKAAKRTKPVVSVSADKPEPKRRATDAVATPAATAKRVTATTAKAYLPAEERKALLDKAVLKVIKRDGIAGVTRVSVAKEAGVSNSLLRHYYTSAEGLKIAAVQLSVDAGDLRTANKAIAAGFDVKLLTRAAQKALK